MRWHSSRPNRPKRNNLYTEVIPAKIFAACFAIAGLGMVVRVVVLALVGRTVPAHLAERIVDGRGQYVCDYEYRASDGQRRVLQNEGCHHVDERAIYLPMDPDLAELDLGNEGLQLAGGALLFLAGAFFVLARPGADPSTD